MAKLREEVDYIINTDQAFAAADAVQKRFSEIQVIPDASKQASSLAALQQITGSIRQSLDQQLRVENAITASRQQQVLQAEQAIAKAQTLRTTLREVTSSAQASESPIWNTFVTGANRAATQVRGLYSELKDLRVAASTATEPIFISMIRQRTREVEADIDRLNTKMQRVAAGRIGTQDRLNAAATNRRETRLNRANTGLGIASQAASFIPGPVGDAASTITNVASNLLTLGPALLAALAPVVAIGAAAGAVFGVVYKITSDIRSEAERQLKAEEKIVGLRNKQILAGKEILENFKQQEAFAARDRQFGQNTPGLNDEGVRSRQAVNRQALGIASLDPERNKEKIAQLQKEITADTNELNRRTDEAQEQVNQSFENRWENYKKLQESAAQFEREQIEKGKERLKELEETWKNVFDRLNAQSGADNPFSRVFEEARKTIEELKKDITGLPPAMQATALQMQREANSNQLFGARLDSRLQALDLRQQASNLRNFRAPIDAETAEDYAARLERISNTSRTMERLGLAGRSAAELNNPQVLALMAGANARSIPGLSPGSFPGVAIASYRLLQQQQADAGNAGMSAQERFQAQIDAIEGLPAGNEDQRSLARRRALAIGGSGQDLSQEQRDKLARFADEEAAKTDRMEGEALTREKERDGYIRAIAEHVKGLADKNAAGGGIGAIEAELRITGETEGTKLTQQKKEATRAATPEDTKRLYGEFQDALGN